MLQPAMSTKVNATALKYSFYIYIESNDTNICFEIIFLQVSKHVSKILHSILLVCYI